MLVRERSSNLVRYSNTVVWRFIGDLAAGVLFGIARTFSVKHPKHTNNLEINKGALLRTSHWLLEEDDRRRKQRKERSSKTSHSSPHTRISATPPTDKTITSACFLSTMKASVLLSIASVALQLSPTNALPFGLSLPWASSNTASDSDSCLIKLGPNEYKMIKESEKLQLKRQKINFIDVTAQIPLHEAVAKGLLIAPGRQSFFEQATLLGSKQLDTVTHPQQLYTYPTSAKHSKSVVPLFSEIDIVDVQHNLGNFTSFFTRYYKSQSGYELALWLQGKINEILTDTALEKGVTVSTVDHKKWDQFSIIVTIPGANYKSPSEKGNIVVIGSHQDSTNLVFPNLLGAPGADDDGSGTVTCLEALRVLIKQFNAGTFAPTNTLEFHFYSAEEGGLLGSYDVFSQYKDANHKVVGMLQQDMTGFSAKTKDQGIEPHMGLVTDYTTPNLNSFVKLMVDTYCAIPYHETSCGYACSDHSSAVENGFPASFVIESEFSLINGYIHSVMDTIDRIDWEHLTEHVKLTIAFAYELSSTKDI